MRTRICGLLIALALAACSGGTASLPAGMPQSQGRAPEPLAQLQTLSTITVERACAEPAPDHRACYALRRTDIAPQTLAGVRSMSISLGYGPSQLAAAYDLGAAQAAFSGSATVAVVDAYDDPNAAADLNQYRQTFGLTPCSSSNPCFTKVSQTGSQTTFPTPDKGWAQEESIDVDMVSAICPQCNILLVEANDSSNANLAAAVDYAASQAGVVAISNSYGSLESGPGMNIHYNHPGIVITASNGDNGYGASQPAAYPPVVAVGGTRLLPAANARGWIETAWSCKSATACSSSGTGGAGSGCSALTAKPVWQTDTGCTMRSIGDVSAIADPATGVFIYDSYKVTPGFYIFGGTSVASPVIASIFALARNGPEITKNSSAGAPKYIWSHYAGNLNDITSGTNEPSAVGSCATAWNYICKAQVGYDGLTGWGTPEGTGAF